jgi:hypothetical protein
MARSSAATYRQLLEEAQELGRTDGRFAAEFEAPGNTTGGSACCLGRMPAEFALLLWEDRPGTPPSGLELNAPLWYATGFAEGLAAGRAAILAAEAERGRRIAETLRLRRVFT